LRLFLLYGKIIHMMIPRYLKEPIARDLNEKMVFLSGPRQVGKTTLAKTFLTRTEDLYFNWDNRDDRKKILSSRWPAVPCIIVFDELHKYRSWKSWVKGEYDVHGERIRMLITGSARMDIYRKGGDSLQGRYHAHRLHGFSIGELAKTAAILEPGQEIIFPDPSNHDMLLSLYYYGPFPEPFLRQNKRHLRRWQRERMDRFFRDDVRELENIRDLSAIELLAAMLEDRVGNPLSLQSLREGLEVSHRAVTHWIDILERLYFCFRVPPLTHSAVRSLKKTAKVYLWDWTMASNEGSRFENLIACHLLKMKHSLEDQEGYRIGLYYLRDASKREVDFLVTNDEKPWFAVECKTSRSSVSPALHYFGKRLSIPFMYQVSLEGTEDVLDSGIRIMPAGKFLSALP
jgi:predicted AAA+ superfamily ATPase